jgi:small-conductance mechanosensitive channel/CRP-like cAMP-binding protein
VSLQSLLKAPPAVYGLAIGGLGVLVLVLFLPARERRLVRGPLLLLAVYGVCRSAVDLFPPTDVLPKVLRFVAAFTWSAAFVRGAFILFSSSRITRFVKPWPKILRDIVQAVLYVGVALISLRAVGVEPGSLLTTSALLTAILGFSMQETLGNLFAGLALQSQQTVAVGDWIRFEAGPDGVGEVIEINWRATHFLTNTRVQVVVPNGVLARATVRNYSRPTPLVRQDIDVVLPYGVSPERARAVILGSLRGLEGIVPEPAPVALVMGFNDSGVVYSVRSFINDYGQRDPIEAAIRQRILYALRRAHLDIPFPHLQLLRSGTGTADLLSVPAKDLSAAKGDVKPPSDLGKRLGRTEIFRDLDPTLLDELGKTTQPLLFAPGEAIIRQGEPGTELYSLERGRVEVVVGGENGIPVGVSVLEPGAVFGEAAFLTGGRRIATIVALTECEVLAIPRSALHHLLDKNRPLSERLTKVLADRMDQLSHALHKEAQSGLDEDRRSDLLIARIRQFFGQ